MSTITTILLVLLYLVIGFAISCMYNAFTNVPMPADMTEEDKNTMFGIILFWPIVIVAFFVKRIIYFLKWAIKSFKKKKKMIEIKPSIYIRPELVVEKEIVFDCDLFLKLYYITMVTGQKYQVSEEHFNSIV